MGSSSSAEIMGRMIMKTPKQQYCLSKKILVLAIFATIGAAHADDEDNEDLLKLTKPESTISVGAGGVSGNSNDRSIFGQYNGWRNNDANPLLDFNINKLNDATGLWTKFEGHNLGLDNRELSFSQNKQGDWKYSFEYNEITHHEIRTIDTGLQGAGSTTPAVNAANPINALNLQLQRQAVTLGGEKWLTTNLMFEASFKNEDKNGARLSGAGIACSPGGVFTAYSRFTCGNSFQGALLMLPEPVNTNTKQIEAKLNYSGDKFLLSGGYYGSFFSNANGSIDPTLVGNFASYAGYLSPIALQPNNQSQQLSVAGNYAFTPTTHSTFKYAYTHGTQDQSFSSMDLSGGPAGISSLGAVVDTNLAQFGLTSHPTSKLSLLANLRYEDKDDKTPQLAKYNQTAAGNFYNNNYSTSQTKLNGKLEAAYQLPDKYRATFGIDYATVQLPTPPTSLGAATDLGLALGGMRANTKEISYRAELRRSLSDTANGAVSYVHSQRTGDNWTFYGNNGQTGTQPLNTNAALPMTMMDRNRDKVKLSADWSPTSKLSLQFNLENGQDNYTGPIETGMNSTKMTSYGIDAAYVMSESWKLTGYVNQSDQTLYVNHTSAYLAELDDVNTSVGLGVVGKPTPKLDIGGNLTYMDDSNRYNQSLNSVGDALPNVSYRVTSLKLFGKYAVKKDADVKVDLVHQNATLDEWTWRNNGTPFAYSDNSTVSMQPNQSVTFLGVSYVYKYR
jgi:MtrB/PioB family decaheme-associated outer membrane protein